MFDFESVLQEDEIALAVFVGHFLLQGRAEGVEGGGAGSYCFGGEEADPAETGEDAVFFVGVFEVGFGGDGPGEVLLGGGGGSEDFGGGFFPGRGCRGGFEEVVGFLGEETHVYEDADEFGEAFVSECTAGDCLGFWD